MATTALQQQAARQAGACTRRRRHPAATPAAAAAAATWRPTRRPGQPSNLQRCAAEPDSSSGFHQSLLVATERGAPLPPLPGPLTVRQSEDDGELAASAWLRALSFYRYPEERKFAAQMHRTMIAEEELKTLQAAKLSRALDESKPGARERSACLVALCPAAGLTEPATGEPIEERLVLGSDDGSSSSSSGNGGGNGGGYSSSAVALVGTLDLYAVRALPGEVLIGDSQNAAYLANVCTATAARRRGVGEALLAEARRLAREWSVDDLYVHTMAVNEIAVRFYQRAGFVVEKEETSNQAHYRGRCLDGIEGRGRTLLLRDARLRG